MNDSIASSADQEGEGKKSATKRTLNTSYRVRKIAEEKTYIQEKPRTAHTQEEKNIWRNTTEEIQTRFYTTIAKMNIKDAG